MLVSLFVNDFVYRILYIFTMVNKKKYDGKEEIDVGLFDPFCWLM